jgi:hypothetical protein
MDTPGGNRMFRSESDRLERVVEMKAHSSGKRRARFEDATPTSSSMLLDLTNEDKSHSKVSTYSQMLSSRHPDREFSEGCYVEFKYQPN